MAGRRVSRLSKKWQSSQCFELVAGVCLSLKGTPMSNDAEIDRAKVTMNEDADQVAILAEGNADEERIMRLDEFAAIASTLA